MPKSRVVVELRARARAALDRIMERHDSNQTLAVDRAILMTDDIETKLDKIKGSKLAIERPNGDIEYYVYI